MGLDPAHTMHLGDRAEMDGVGARTAGVRFALVHGPRDVGRVVIDVLAGALAAAPPSSP